MTRHHKDRLNVTTRLQDDGSLGGYALGIKLTDWRQLGQQYCGPQKWIPSPQLRQLLLCPEVTLQDIGKKLKLTTSAKAPAKAPAKCKSPTVSPAASPASKRAKGTP